MLAVALVVSGGCSGAPAASGRHSNYKSNHHSTHDRHSPSASVPSHVHCRRMFCHMCHGRIVCAAAQASAFNTASIPDSITTGSKHDTSSAVTVTQPAHPRPCKYRQVLRSSAKSSANHSRHASPREANTTRVHANRLCSCRIGQALGLQVAVPLMKLPDMRCALRLEHCEG